MLWEVSLKIAKKKLNREAETRKKLFNNERFVNLKKLNFSKIDY